VTATSPIIVTGADRSGTTLLYALLASHPHISMVRRTNMWRWFDQRFGDLAVPENLDRCLDTMLRYRRLDVLEPDATRIRAEFGAGPPTYGRLFDLFHRHHADRRGRRRWGDKSLHTEFHADRVFSELSGARIVHLFRDPRDRYASILRRYPDRTKGIGAAMGRWRASMVQGHRNLERHPDRYMLVRYETLARAPEPTLRRICAFLDEVFRPEMLGMGGVSDDDWSGNSSFGNLEPGVISTRPIGRYRSTLTPRQVAFIQTCANRTMRTHGYEPDPVQLSVAQRVTFYATDLPLGSVRLAGWLAGRRISQWRGGRAPEARLRSPAPA
jgi:hypothetical protein